MRTLTALSPIAPSMPARKTLRLMNTEELGARRAGPPVLLISDETSDAESFYACEIVNHAHAVLGSVASVQVSQRVAGEGVTAEAVLGLIPPNPRASFDSAYDSGFRFGAVVRPAAGTRVPVSYVGAAEATVHAAGGDQSGGDPIVSHSGLHRIATFAGYSFLFLSADDAFQTFGDGLAEVPGPLLLRLAGFAGAEDGAADVDGLVE